MFGTFGRPLDTFLDYPGSRRFFEVIQRLARITGPAGAKALLPLYSSPLAFEISRRTGLVDRYYCARQDLEVYLEHLSQMDTRVFLRMVDAIKDHDMESFLPRVHVPTLIFAGENDLFTPLHRSRAMAAAIPDAEMMVLAEGSHAAIVEHPETINLRIDRFLEERL